MVKPNFKIIFREQSLWPDYRLCEQDDCQVQQLSGGWRHTRRSLGSRQWARVIRGCDSVVCMEDIHSIHSRKLVECSLVSVIYCIYIVHLNILWGIKRFKYLVVRCGKMGKLDWKQILHPSSKVERMTEMLLVLKTVIK